MLSIHLLGATSVTLDSKRLTINRRKSRALLFFLAAHIHPVSRNRLLTILWADHTPDTARSNLRSTLYNLRQALGDYVEADADMVCLTGPVQVDVRELAAFPFDALSRKVSSLPPTEAQSQAEQAAIVLAHYGGTFLADFELPDTPEFEEWVALERERQLRAAIRGYEVLSRLHLRAGAIGPALTAIEDALALDPFQEDLQRSALALHFRAGDRAGAIRRFEEFSTLLDEQMGVPPMAETQTLYDAIVTDAPLPPAYAEFSPPAQEDSTQSPERPALPRPPVAEPPLISVAGPDAPVHLPPQNARTVPAPASTQAARPQPATPVVPFVGRRAELEQLVTWYATRRLILVEGEPGMGKTSLVHHFLQQQATADAAIILNGRARELESGLPYQPIIEALRSVTRASEWKTWRQTLQLPAIWQHEVARLLPDLESGPGWETRQSSTAQAREVDASRLWEGIYQWLAALAQLHPVLLFIDDLHWADTATLGLLGYLTRRVAGEPAPIRLLAAGHPVRTRTESATLIQSLTREELLHRLVLHPLSRDEVLALAQELSPHYAHPLGNWLYRSAEGSPFVLVHLLRHAWEIDLISEDGVVNIHRLPTETVVPQTVYTLVQSRLESLSESARRVLDAAVAVGREFDFEVVARASALSDMAALDALDELRRQRLILNVGGERFSFDHSLTREVAYREVGEVRHRLLHRRVAAALESIYPDQLDEIAGLLLHHYREGNAPAEAYQYALRAGRRAASIAAWQPAIQFYQQARELLPADVTQADRLALHLALGNAYLHAGEMQRATATLRQVVTDARADHVLPVLRSALQALAEALINQARYDEVVAIAESMQGIEDPDLSFTIDFMWAAGLSVGGRDLASAAEHLLAAETRIGDATDAVSRVRLAQIAFELGSIDAQQGRLDSAINRYRRAIELTTPLATDDMIRWHILARNNLAYHLHLLGDPDQTATALEAAKIGYTLAQERGLLSMHGYLLSTLGEIALAQGDLDGAERYFTTGLRYAHQLTQPERIAGITANLGLLALARNLPQQAREHFQFALEVATAIPNRYLMAQINLWLAPLVPVDDAESHLSAAQTIIEQAGYGRLRVQLQSLRTQISTRA